LHQLHKSGPQCENVAAIVTALEHGRLARQFNILDRQVDEVEICCSEIAEQNQVTDAAMLAARETLPGKLNVARLHSGTFPGQGCQNTANPGPCASETCNGSKCRQFPELGAALPLARSAIQAAAVCSADFTAPHCPAAG
jgi:hypothetical protein